MRILGMLTGLLLFGFVALPADMPDWLVEKEYGPWTNTLQKPLEVGT